MSKQIVVFCKKRGGRDNLSNIKKVSLSSVKSVQSGFALLEALIALLIFSMGILALVGLQTAMLKNTTASKFRADASYLAQQRLGLIWADPNNAAIFSTDAVIDDISNLLPEGTRTVTDLGGGQVRIVITWKDPGAVSTHNLITDARINL